MLKGDVPRVGYVYTCLNPTCGERSFSPMVMCKKCRGIRIGMRLVLEERSDDCMPLLAKREPHPLVEDLDPGEPD